MNQDVPQQDTLYNSFDRSLYKKTGEETFDNIMDAINANPTADNSAMVNVPPDTTGSGQGSGVTSFSNGGIESGKQAWNDNTAGFFFGIDGDGVAKLNIGSASSFVKWDGTSLTISGTLTAGSLNIPDTTTANSFHVDALGNAWWGATTLGASTAKVLNTGVATFSNITITGGSISNVPISNIPNSTATDISLLNYTHDLVFSIDGTIPATKVDWASGTITMSNGRTFSISSGNTGVMAARTYIYLDTGVSSTVLQTTTTVSTAMGANKILLAVAQNGSGQATFQVYGGIGGLKVNSGGINIANNNWTFDGIFSATSATVVSWGNSATIDDSYSETNKDSEISQYPTSGGAFFGQSFTNTTASTLDSCKFYCRKVGSPTGNAKAKLYAHTGTYGTNGLPTGAVLATSDNFDVSTLTGSSALITLNFSSANRVSMSTSTHYFIILDCSGITGDISNRILTSYDSTSPSHGGNWAESSDGSSWSGDNSVDVCFYVYSVLPNTLKTSDGTSYSISGSNTGTMSAPTYIYFDLSASITAFQTTTTSTSSVGDGKILIAIASNNTNGAIFQVFGGTGGNNIDGSAIVPLSINAAEIAAATITGAKIAAATIAAGNIISGTITATQIAANTITASLIAANTITASQIAAATITGTQIAASTITSGKISVSQLSAISADLGSITAGSITINSGVASISSVGAAVFKSIQVGGSNTQYTLNDSGIVSYGDASDGAATCDGSTSVAGMSLAGSTYTMTRNCYFTNLTVNNTIILNLNGYILYGTGTLTNNGTINRNGNNGNNGANGNTGGAGGTGGASLADGYLKGVSAGADGGNGGAGGGGGANGTNGNNGTATTNSLGSTASNSGQGGDVSGKTGGTTGTAGTFTANNLRLTVGFQLSYLLDISSSGATVKYTASPSSGGAGGGAGSTTSAGGGGGGAGSSGGIVVIFFRVIINNTSKVISANGGNGGNGGDGQTNVGPPNGAVGGGGAGANGGIIILAYNQLTNSGSITVTAGTKGTKGVNGTSTNATDGTNGSAGTIYQFNLSL